MRPAEAKGLERALARHGLPPTRDADDQPGRAPLVLLPPALSTESGRCSGCSRRSRTRPSWRRCATRRRSPLMGLELTGLGRPDKDEVWIDPAENQPQLTDATQTLTAAGITTKIFNHQLCVLDLRLWPFAVRSISDWKNDYLPICSACWGRQGLHDGSQRQARLF